MSDSSNSTGSEQHLWRVLDGLFAFAGVLTPEGTLVEANRAALQAASLLPEDVLGKPFEETYWWSYSPEVQRELRAAIERAARGEPSRYDVLNRVSENRFITVDFMLAPLFDDQGQVTHLIPSAVDITEKRKLESELLRAMQLSLMGELAAGLAHEVKNPLAGIKGAVDILIQRRAVDDPEIEVLEDMRHAVGRIDKTVQALMQGARPRSPQLARASLTEVVHRAVVLARHHAADSPSNGSRISVTFEPPTESFILPIDPAYIEDAVLNLLLNSIEAISTGGRVMVRIRRERANSTGRHDEAVIEVEDTGCGISAEDLAQVFNLFYTTRQGGTGLGLPAVRRIAQAHDGRVEVRSEPKHGTTFSIYLPIRSPVETS